MTAAYDGDRYERIVAYMLGRLSLRDVKHDPQPEWLWFSNEHVSDAEKRRGWADYRDGVMLWCPDVFMEVTSGLRDANGSKTPGTLEHFLDIVCGLMSYQRIAAGSGKDDPVMWAEDKVFDKDPVAAITLFRVLEGLDPDPDEGDLVGTDTWIDGVDLDLTLDAPDLDVL